MLRRKTRKKGDLNKVLESINAVDKQTAGKRTNVLFEKKNQKDAVTITDKREDSKETVGGIDNKAFSRFSRDVLLNINITPSEYFRYLKDMKADCTDGVILKSIEKTIGIMEQAKITNQTRLANMCATNLELLIKEQNAINHGYTEIINRADFDAWVTDVMERNKSDSSVLPISSIELSQYPRTIPDDVVEEIAKAKDIFDDMVVVFTDYTGEAERQVKKEKMDKDPILFGIFYTKTESGNVMPSKRLYFIADWEDEYCDLTFDELIKDSKKVFKKDIRIPSDDLTKLSVDELRKILIPVPVDEKPETK